MSGCPHLARGWADLERAWAWTVSTILCDEERLGFSKNNLMSHFIPIINFNFTDLVNFTGCLVFESEICVWCLLSTKVNCIDTWCFIVQVGITY